MLASQIGADLFLERGGREAIVTDVAHLVQAVEGQAGTRVVTYEGADPVSEVWINMELDLCTC